MSVLIRQKTALRAPVRERLALASPIRGPDDAVGASEYNRENHPWHYWLNRSKSSQQRGNGGKGSSWARTMAKNGNSMPVIGRWRRPTPIAAAIAKEPVRRAFQPLCGPMRTLCPQRCFASIMASLWSFLPVSGRNHPVVRLEIWAVVTLFLGPISGEMFVENPFRGLVAQVHGERSRMRLRKRWTGF